MRVTWGSGLIPWASGIRCHRPALIRVMGATPERSDSHFTPRKRRDLARIRRNHDAPVTSKFPQTRSADEDQGFGSGCPQSPARQHPGQRIVNAAMSISARRCGRLCKVDSNRCELGPERLDEAGMPGPAPCRQALPGVVAVYHHCSGETPSCPVSDPDLGFGFEVANPGRVSALLGDDPHRVAVVVSADDGPSTTPGPLSACLDDDVARDETEPDEQLHRWVEEPPLECNRPAPFALVTGCGIGHCSPPRMRWTRSSSASSSVCNHGSRSGS